MGRAEGKENARVIGRSILTLPHVVHAATGIALAGITLTHDQTVRAGGGNRIGPGRMWWHARARLRASLYLLWQ